MTDMFRAMFRKFIDFSSFVENLVHYRNRKWYNLTTISSFSIQLYIMDFNQYSIKICCWVTQWPSFKCYCKQQYNVDRNYCLARLILRNLVYCVVKYLFSFGAAKYYYLLGIKSNCSKTLQTKIFERCNLWNMVKSSIYVGGEIHSSHLVHVCIQKCAI